MPRIAEPSVKSLLVVMRANGHDLATGTAFVAESPRGPVLLTNRHNVTGVHQETGELLHPTGAVPDELVIIHNRRDRLGEWVRRTEPLFDQDAQRLWHEHPMLGSEADFVALPLTQLDDVALYSYDLTDAGPAIQYGPGDVVSVVGFPFGLQAGGSLAVWATGFVASEPAVDFAGKPLLLIDCRTRQGQSGSAVIAYRSGGMVALEDGSAAAFSGPVTRFIGIYSGRIRAESDIGMVWKHTAIKELVHSME